MVVDDDITSGIKDDARRVSDVAVSGVDGHARTLTGGVGTTDVGLPRLRDGDEQKVEIFETDSVTRSHMRTILRWNNELDSHF